VQPDAQTLEEISVKHEVFRGCDFAEADNRMSDVLAQGDGFVLIGAVVSSEGFRPVGFASGFDSEFGAAVAKLVQPTAINMMEQIKVQMEIEHATEN
jgi:hypothetical protein